LSFFGAAEKVGAKGRSAIVFAQPPPPGALVKVKPSPGVESVEIAVHVPALVSFCSKATETTEGQVAEAIEVLREDLAEGRRGVVLREVAGGFSLASDPASEEAARRLLAKPRTPPLTQAQASYQQGVLSEHALQGALAPAESLLQ